MSPVYRRVLTAVMIAYLVTLAAIVLWPSSDLQFSVVVWTHATVQELGAPGWVSTSAVEFASNIALFVPLSLLGSLLWQRWTWVAWTMAGFASSLVIETTQTLLSGRSPTLLDVVANTLGALVGALLVLPVWSRTHARTR